MMAVHFINFKSGEPERYARAVRLFGEPDFVHPKWDLRAKIEIVPGDVAVFAHGTSEDQPSFYPVTEEMFR